MTRCCNTRSTRRAHEPPRAADVERAVAVEAPGLFDLDTLLFG